MSFCTVVMTMMKMAIIVMMILMKMIVVMMMKMKVIQSEMHYEQRIKLLHLF